MGIDLTLCPFRHHPGPWTWHLAYDRMSLHRDYQIFGQIDKNMGRAEKIKVVCDPQRLPPGVRFTWYGDEGIKDETENPYGDTLTYVEAFELAKVKVDNTSDYNKAVFTMIRALEPRTPIVLWWH